MKNTKKVRLLVTLILLSTLFISSVAHGYGPSKWAAAEVEEARKNNLTTERVLNNYQKDITREEFCELVVKLYEAISGTKANPVSPNPFTDTKNPEILKANNLGIVGGKGKGIFAPNDPITRQEITTMILRALKAVNPNMNVDTKGVKAFADEDQISSWAIEAVRFANKSGIMGGVGGNRVNPRGNTSREQAILFVQRAYERFSDTDRQHQSDKTTKPARPEMVYAAPISSSEIVLGWTEVDNADYYYVYISEREDGPYTELLNVHGAKEWKWVGGFSLRQGAIAPGTTIYYKVTAVRNGIESDFSDVAHATVLITYDEYAHYLYETASQFNINNYEYSFIFEDIQVFEGQDGYLYLTYHINTEEVGHLIKAYNAGFGKNIYELFYNEVISQLQDYYYKDIKAYLIYNDYDLDFYPEDFSTSSIFSVKTVEYDSGTNTWEVYYPVLEIISDLNDENYYFTWDL